MVSFGRGPGRGQHPEDAALHAWMKGELEPTPATGVTAHVSGCAACQERIARMEPVIGGLEQLGERDLDDLSWHRIAQAVKRELEAPERPSFAPSFAPTGAVWTQRWVSGVVVTAAVVALFVWGSPPLRVAQKDGSAPAGATLASGERGYSVRLPSGVELGLAPDTEVRLGRSEATPSLFLQVGELELLVPESIELPAGGFEVRAPAFRVSARSGRLRVGYWSREYFVEVQEGEARLRPEGRHDAVTIHQGERRTVHLVSGPTASRVPERRVIAPPARPAAEPAAPEVPAPAETRAAERGSARDPGVSTRAAGDVAPEETHVEVIPPPADPLRDRLLEANRAFYEARDVARAIALAEEVAASDAPRPEVRLAHALLCEAHLAEHRPEKAVAACKEHLARETDPESLREIHLKLGAIERTLLGRCEEAIRHYSEAIVFGRVSLIDTEARLGRATCALELGDWELAERDLALLGAAPGLHRERIEALSGMLENLRNSKDMGVERRHE